MHVDLVLSRLRDLAEAQVGGPIPGWLDSNNNWGPRLSELAAAAFGIIQQAQFADRNGGNRERSAELHDKLKKLHESVDKLAAAALVCARLLDSMGASDLRREAP